MRTRPTGPEPTPVRCAIYTRKSTTAGLEQSFNSLDAQTEACLHFIQSQAHLGWRPCAQRYEDGGFTGANTDRPGFQRLLADLEAGRLEVVVVYKVDRLSRSLLDFAQVMERFTARGVAFVSVTQNFSTVDAMGRLTLNMLMSFAEFEREMITERIRDKVSAMRRKGHWTGGMVPFGYKVYEKQLKVLPEEADWVRWLFRTYQEGRSVLDLVETLNAQQVPFKSRLKPKPNPWSKDAVLRVLRNRLYVGVIASRGTWYPGQHEALVAEADFARVQTRLARPSQGLKGRFRNPHYLVRGTLRCGGCGAALTSGSTQKGGRVYRYYRCTTRDKKGRQACPTRQLPAEAIETFVVDQIREAIRDGRIDPAGLEQLAQQLEQSEEGQGEAAELRWLGGVLAQFDGVWVLLSSENRQRLIRRLVQEVVVAEQAGVIRVTLTDLMSGGVA